MTTQTALDTSQYLGTWYEIQRDNESPFEWWAECGTARYDLNTDGTIQVRNNAFFWYAFFQYIEVSATGYVQDANGNLKVAFIGDESSVAKENYQVIYTDYTNHAVVYSCADTWYGAKQEQVWIISRTPAISAADIVTLRKKVTDQIPDYKWGYEMEVRHDGNCKYKMY